MGDNRVGFEINAERTVRSRIRVGADTMGFKLFLKDPFALSPSKGRAANFLTEGSLLKVSVALAPLDLTRLCTSTSSVRTALTLIAGITTAIIKAL